MTADVTGLSTAATVRSSARAVLINQVEVDVVHHGGRLTLHVTTAVVTRRLDGAESTSGLRIVIVCHAAVVVRDGLLAISLLMARLNN